MVKKIKFVTLSLIALSALFSLTACGDPNAGTAMAIEYETYMENQPYVTDVEARLPNTLPYSTSGGDVYVTIEPNSTKKQVTETILHATKFKGNFNTNIIFNTPNLEAQFYVKHQDKQDLTLSENNSDTLNYVYALTDTNTINTMVYILDYDGPELTIKTTNDVGSVFNTVTQLTEKFSLNEYVNEYEGKKTSYGMTYTVTQNDKFTITTKNGDDITVTLAAYNAAVTKFPQLTSMQLSTELNLYTINSAYSVETEAYLVSLTPEIKTVVNFSSL